MLLGQAQKTFFIETERKTQDVIIDGKMWDKEPFFTVNPSTGAHQVIIKEKGYKNEFDILREGIHSIFTTSQKIKVDTLILSKVKPIELTMSESMTINIYDVDYVGYMKDISYSGKISDAYQASKYSELIQSGINPKILYLVNELNEYHNMTRGRYDFYSLGMVQSIDIYVVTLDDNTKFLTSKVKVDWSITRKNTDDLPQYTYEAISGKMLYNPEAKTQSSAVNAVIHDALFSSLLSFLTDQEPKLKRTM
jgi:hypothetical protein